MATNLLVDDKGTEETLQNIFAVASQCNVMALRGLPQATKTFRRARGMAQLDSAMSDARVMGLIKQFAGSQIGFGMDKPKYDDVVLRRCALIALLKGASLESIDGPEWMIIGEKTYLCKPFYQRILREMEGIANIVVRPGRHEQTEANTAYVPVVVELRDHGRLRRWEFVTTPESDSRIPVRVNAGMIVDAILGKAEAKALRRVYAELSGEDISDEPPEQAESVFDAK